MKSASTLLRGVRSGTECKIPREYKAWAPIAAVDMSGHRQVEPCDHLLARCLTPEVAKHAPPMLNDRIPDRGGTKKPRNRALR